MHGLNVSRRSLDGKQLNDLLVDDLMRLPHGSKAAVVVDDPRAALSAVRKRWMKKIRKLHIERAKQLAGPQASHLSDRIVALEATTFTAQLPQDQLEANITFATADDLIRLCLTSGPLFITADVLPEKRHMLTAWMRSGSIVVIYEQ